MTDVKTFQAGVYVVGDQNDDTGEAFVQIQIRQAGVYALGSRAAEQTWIQQAGVALLAMQETSTGLYETQVYQMGAYALVKAKAGRREMRAYTITQDDHDFYILNLGVDRTLVLDLQTEQWSVWRSDGINCWRPQDGLDWEQQNIGGDFLEGLLWTMDPAASLDDGVSGGEGDQVPIRSIVRGFHPLRLRNALGCFRAVLTISQGAPAADGVGITLRTSDDMGASWLDHGELVLDIISYAEYDVAWSSLGQIVAPGRIFEIIDTGYARRIEALDIDLGGEGENGDE